MAIISYYSNFFFFFNISPFVEVVVFNTIVRHFIGTSWFFVNMLENVICYHETSRDL